MATHLGWTSVFKQGGDVGLGFLLSNVFDQLGVLAVIDLLGFLPAQGASFFGSNLPRHSVGLLLVRNRALLFQISTVIFSFVCFESAIPTVTTPIMPTNTVSAIITTLRLVKLIVAIAGGATHSPSPVPLYVVVANYY